MCANEAQDLGTDVTSNLSLFVAELAGMGTGCAVRLSSGTTRDWSEAVGAVVVLFGANGSGKTRLLGALEDRLGTVLAAHGEVRIVLDARGDRGDTETFEVAVVKTVTPALLLEKSPVVVVADEAATMLGACKDPSFVADLCAATDRRPVERRTVKAAHGAATPALSVFLRVVRPFPRLP